MDQLLERVVKVIVNPILQVFIAVAVVIFVYGIFEFIRGAENPETRKKGQQHMLYGLIGLTIMISVFTIMRIILNTLGLQGPNEIPAILNRN